MNASWKVLPFVLGDLETNAYLLTQGSESLLIDPGQDPRPILKLLEEQNLTLKAVYLTHAHADHIAGLGRVQATHPCPVFLHPAEKTWLSDPGLNLSASIGSAFVWDGPLLELNEGPWPLLSGGTVWHTPGHSPGGVCLALSGTVFTGDLLFAGSVGRTDFPGGNPVLLSASLKKLLEHVDPQAILYPGHGPPTTMEAEWRNNPYLKVYLQGLKA